MATAHELFTRRLSRLCLAGADQDRDLSMTTRCPGRLRAAADQGQYSSFSEGGAIAKLATLAILSGLTWWLVGKGFGATTEGGRAAGRAAFYVMSLETLAPVTDTQPVNLPEVAACSASSVSEDRRLHTNHCRQAGHQESKP